MHTIYHFQYKIEHHPKLIQICSYKIFFPKGLKKEFETAMVNEPSVFEPSKFYCIAIYLSVFNVTRHQKHKEATPLTVLLIQIHTLYCKYEASHILAGDWYLSSFKHTCVIAYHTKTPKTHYTCTRMIVQGQLVKPTVCFSDL